MSIEVLEKVTLLGHMHNKNAVLIGLQAMGCLHLIPLTPEGKATGSSGPSKNAREALRFLASATPRRRQATNPKNFDAAHVEQQALSIRRQRFELINRRDFISTRIDNLAAWGDVEFPSIEELGGNRLWFYLVPHHLMGDIRKTDLRWQLTHSDQRYCYVVVVSPDEPTAMPVQRLPTGGVSLHRLVEELEEVESALEDVEAERLGLTRWCNLFARSLDGLEDRAARAQAAAQTAEAAPVFALQAWVPEHRMDELRAYASRQTLALQVTVPESSEQPPTLFNNPPPLRAGEDLVKFYMTPSYWLWDPSSVVFASFALFFAMIVADAGYGMLMGGLVLAYRKRLGAGSTDRRWLIMLAVLAAGTATYGVLAGSYFGLTPPPGSLLDRLHILDLGDFTTMMALSVVIGATHIASANVMDALRHRRWPQRLPPLGWACAIVGGTMAWGGMQMSSDVMLYGGCALLCLGLLAVMGYAGYGEKPLVRALRGLTALAGVSGAFGDVLSYLRLFALGLASASLAIAFNDMAGNVREAMPGLGFLFALLILVLGHGLNFLLSVSSGFIHGLRLNVIEFFKWGVKDEGFPYRPFEKKESPQGEHAGRL